MLSRIVELSLRFRGIVVALACLVMAYGLFVAMRTKLDVFPEFAPPQVVIQTEAPGLSPEEVEQLVTRPLEAGLNGSPGLEAIRSQSIQGLSAIALVFREDADIFKVRQLVSERLTEVAGELPQGVKAPKMGPLTSSTGLFLALGLTSSNRTAMELRTFADWSLRPRLLGVPGIAKVDIFGGEVRQLQVQVKPERLVAFGLALNDVLDATRSATAIRGAGFVENANQRVVLRTEGQSLTADELAETVLAHHNSASVRLRDVADVAEGAEPKFGDAQINGERGVILLLWTQYGANTLEVTAAAERTLEEMRPALSAEQITLNPRLFRPASFIETSLRNIRFSLLLGAMLVVGVLFLFLLDLRTALISFVSIPLSLLAAVIVLDRLGVSLNTLTLGGFAIAIGVVVDDAIIDVENILRRLRENLALSKPRPLFRVVLDASLEVRSAIVYATFIVALVFVPVLTMSAVSGRIFAPLAVAFVLATLASLAVALTVTPALCYLLLSRIKPHNEPKYVGWLKLRHRRWLEGVSRYPRTIIGLAVLVCAGAVATVPFLGGEFLPEFREGHLIVHMATVPGTSLEESLRLGREVTRELLANPHVRSVAQQAGRAENGEDTWGTHLSEFHVDLNSVSGEEAEFIPAELRTALLKFPGATFKIMPFLVERMEETISGATAEVAVNLYGDNLSALDTAAAQVRGVLTSLRGAVDVVIESQPGAPEMVARLRRDRLRQFGFRPAEVLDAVQTAYQGSDVAQVFDGNRVHDVAVILHPQERRYPETFGSLLVRSSAGTRMPLAELADVSPGTGRYVVIHEGAQRRQQVTCNVAGRDGASFLTEAKHRLARANLPAGVRVVFGGSAVAQKVARNELLLHSLMAGVGVVLLLWVVFRSGRNLLLVLANLPFALVGGVLAIFAGGGLLSIGSLVGLVTLFGLTMRNSIMLVSHWEHLVREESQTWNLDTAIRGASERLVPILMTVLVTALGLLPIAISAGEAGHEIEGPMAIVILGGLVTSTLLNLLVLPTLAARWGSFSHTSNHKTNA
ncbi:MAG: acriflavin resistance protein [Verrucomicrobia bacterium SCN 57-15]|nr:MAG: acriflavin resistance protein [Verrucomicrobia bacterium SCN 57-15]